MTEKEVSHLRWCYWRLINIHKENPAVDYMLKMDEILRAEEKKLRHANGFYKELDDD